MTSPKKMKASLRLTPGGKMGTFTTSITVKNHVHRDRQADVSRLLVDTGSESTWIAESILREIGVKTEKKDRSFVMANGTVLTRNVGYAIIRIGEYETIDEIVFAQKGDLQILGAHTMEGLNLRVEPREKKLVSAGPILAAVAA